MKKSTSIDPKYFVTNAAIPRYIFHGTSQKINNTIVPHQAHSDMENESDEQFAIYGTSLLKGAIPYAIGKGKVSCTIGYRPDNMVMKIYRGKIAEDTTGYVYVFDSKDFIRCEDTIQFVADHPVTPIEEILVHYRDFKDLFLDKTSYSNLQTPEELFFFMYYNIEYRWQDQNGLHHNTITPEMYETYSLKTAEEVLKTRCGICTDQVELERDWFQKHHDNYEVLAIQITRENSAPGHVFLLYYQDNHCYWFENAWHDQSGIHCYSSRDQALKTITEKFIEQNALSLEEQAQIEIMP